MPLFDRSLLITAAPPDIAAFLAATAGVNLLTVKAESLYILTENNLSLIYLFQAEPDGRSRIRLVAADAATVTAAFKANPIRGALVTVFASPTPARIDPAVLARITARADALERAFQPRPETPPPIVADAIDPFLRDELLGPASPPKKPRITDMPDLTTLKQPQPVRAAVIPLETVLLVIAGCGVILVAILGANFVRLQFLNAISGLGLPFSQNGVTLNYDSYWTPFPTATLERCNTLALAGFTCYLVLQTGDKNTSLILGGVPSTGALNLGQVESDSLTTLQDQTPGIQRLNSRYIKLSGTVDAIRRDLLVPVRNTDLKHYVTQVYFRYKGILYELTIEAASKDVFSAESAEIETLINSFTFN